jgi:hypothetical protein
MIPGFHMIPLLLIERLIMSCIDYQTANSEVGIEKKIDDDHCNEEKEESMVSVANTVIDVGTVMVESLHTSIADVAVTASIGPDDLAVRA